MNGQRPNPTLHWTGPAERSSSFESWLAPGRPVNVLPLYRTTMLTFETDDDGTVFIHGDAAGLKALADQLNRLVAATPEREAKGDKGSQRGHS